MGGNKLVVKNKNLKTSNSYVYGSSAYDYDKHREPIEPKKPVRKVKTKKKKIRRKKLKLILGVAVIFSMAFVSVGRYTTILTLSADIRAQKKEVQAIQKDNQNLKVELAKLNNTRAIEEEAVSKYQMTYPTNKNTYYISVQPLTDKEEKGKNMEKQSALTTVQKILGLIY